MKTVHINCQTIVSPKRTFIAIKLPMGSTKGEQREVGKGLSTRCTFTRVRQVKVVDKIVTNATIVLSLLTRKGVLLYSVSIGFLTICSLW